MEDSVRHRLEDMIEYGRKALRVLGDRNVDQLITDEVHYLALIHAVQIVGEAARKVPDAVRERVPSVAWRDAVTMRNLLVHDYGDVNPAILIDTVRNDLPPLIADLERLLGETE